MARLLLDVRVSRGRTPAGRTTADNQHLAFGHGIHYCIGAPLAKLEADIALTSLMNRFPDLALAGSADAVEWRPTFATRGPVRLDVTGNR